MTKTRTNIPGGYKFRPSDSELLAFLALFVTGEPISPVVPIVERNLYGGKEPWEIFRGSKDRVRYFFTQLKRKTPDNSRYHRRIGDGKGTWKAQDKGKPIYKYDDAKIPSGQLIGYKRSLRYENKGSEHDGQWLMKEYYLPEKIRSTLQASKKDYVLCRIKRKLDRDVTSPESKIARDIGYIIGDFTANSKTLTTSETSDSPNNSEVD